MSHTQKSQARYESDYNNHLRENATYLPGNYAFTENSPMRANQRTTIVSEHQAYKKLRPQAIIFIEILQVYEKMLGLDDHSIPEIVSIDGAAHASLTSHTAPIPSVFYVAVSPHFYCNLVVTALTVIQSMLLTILSDTKKKKSSIT